MTSEREPGDDGKLWGVYLGTVADTNDPEKRGRVRVQVQSVLPDQVHPTWALPRGQMVAAGTGRFVVPERGATVCVQFLEGDVNLPLYEPGPFPNDQRPQTLREDLDGDGSSYPARRVLWDSARGFYVAEEGSGDLTVVARQSRRLRVSDPDGSALLEFAQLDLGSDPDSPNTKNAARKGDRVDVGSFGVVSTGSSITAVVWTDPDGVPHTLPVSPAPGEPVWGRIIEGAAGVRIGR